MSEFDVGLIGAGHISETHLKAWQRARGCRVTGIFDLDRESAQRRAERFGIDRVYDDLDAMLDAVQVVDICTPPATHAGLLRQAAERRLHILVEKPVVIWAAEWDELKPLFEASPGKLGVLHNLQFARSVQLAKKWVAKGRIGRVLRLTRRFLTSPQGDRMLVGDRHWSHRLPGGRWFETLPHELYLIHSFIGALDLTHVEALSSNGAPAGAPADEVQLTFAGDGAMATVHYSANCRINHRSLSLHGEEGIIYLDILGDSASIHAHGDASWRRAAGNSLLDAGSDLLQSVPDRMAYFTERLRGASPHFKLIQHYAGWLHGEKDSPTPLDEIEYVVRNSERVGRAIDQRLEALGGAR
ncbi:MAG: Gfo/Idh/MocA family oxidoreductase [Acidobacteriota bacterium]